MKMCYNNILDFREIYYRLLIRYCRNIAVYSHSPRVLISIFISRLKYNIAFCYKRFYVNKIKLYTYNMHFSIILQLIVQYINILLYITQFVYNILYLFMKYIIIRFQGLVNLFIRQTYNIILYIKHKPVYILLLSYYCGRQR